MSFKNHFDMLSLHEPVTHKARFWQSYVRALKGTEDMRADEHQARLRLRPRALSEFPEYFGRSLLDDRLVSTRTLGFTLQATDTCPFPERLMDTHQDPFTHDLFCCRRGDQHPALGKSQFLQKNQRKIQLSYIFNFHFRNF